MCVYVRPLLVRIRADYSEGQAPSATSPGPTALPPPLSQANRNAADVHDSRSSTDMLGRGQTLLMLTGVQGGSPKGRHHSALPSDLLHSLCLLAELVIGVAKLCLEVSCGCECRPKHSGRCLLRACQCLKMLGLLLSAGQVATQWRQWRFWLAASGQFQSCPPLQLLAAHATVGSRTAPLIQP